MRATRRRLLGIGLVIPCTVPPAFGEVARAVKAEKVWAETTAAESRLVAAIVGGVRLDAVRGEAERLGVRRAELEQQRGRLALLRGTQEAAIETRLATSRLRHLRELPTLPDVSEIRRALLDVIVRIEIGAGGDGDVRLLIGDGPMEPLPPGLEDLEGGG